METDSKVKLLKTQALIKAILVLVIIVLVNFISVRVFTRFDLTKGNIYTLSEASKNLMRNLDDKLIVKCFFTEDLPAPYNSNRRAVLDLLNDYRAYSKGNLQFEFISPEGEKGEKEAQQSGVPPVEVQVVKEDKFEVKKAYMGMIMMYEDKKEVLPVIQNIASLEYDVSSAIKKLITKTKKRIGYTTGHDELSLPEQRRVYQDIITRYTVVPVDLSSNDGAIPQDLAALLIIAPKNKFSDTAKYKIDQYIMQGGRVAFLINKIDASLEAKGPYERPMARPLNTGLEDLMENYGVRVNEDIVRDRQCASISVVQQQGGFQIQTQIPFPYLPNITNVEKSNPIVKDLKGIIFYFVSSLDTTLASSKGLKIEVLAKSSKYSGRQQGFLLINPFYQYTREDFLESGIPIAAIVSGSFQSFYADSGNGTRAFTSSISRSPETMIIVVGDGDFMMDELTGNPSNAIFFTNIIDYLADDAGLITIRSKNVTPPPLEQLSEGTTKVLKYANILLPPFIIIIYGIIRWRRRVIYKRAIEKQI